MTKSSMGMTLRLLAATVSHSCPVSSGKALAWCQVTWYMLFSSCSLQFPAMQHHRHERLLS